METELKFAAPEGYDFYVVVWPAARTLTAGIGVTTELSAHVVLVQARSEAEALGIGLHEQTRAHPARDGWATVAPEATLLRDSLTRITA